MIEEHLKIEFSNGKLDCDIHCRFWTLLRIAARLLLEIDRTGLYIRPMLTQISGLYMEMVKERLNGHHKLD